MRARVQRLKVLLVSNDVPLAFGCEELERQQNPLALALGSISDHALAQRIAEVYRAQGWPATVIEGTASLTAEYSAPSAGPPPWDVYQVTPQTVYALETAEPYGATKFQF